MLYELNPEERYENIGMESRLSENRQVLTMHISFANLTILIGSHAKKHHPGKVFDSNVPLYLHSQLTRKEFRLADMSVVPPGPLTFPWKHYHPN
jgi:hypothetical protein